MPIDFRLDVQKNLLYYHSHGYLQDRCAAAGLSIEGTKNDLKARLKGSNTVNLVETIIYKNAVQVPQSDEASKAHS